MARAAAAARRGDRPDQQAPPRHRPDRKVARTVPGIVEAALAEFGNQAVALALAAEVGDAVAREHGVEAAETVGHGARDLRVGAGGKHEAPALAPLRTKVLEQFLRHRQGVDVQRRLRGEALLEHGTPLHQPHRQRQKTQRISTAEREQRFDERVGAQQRAVEVDDQRHRIGAGNTGTGIDGARAQKIHFAIPSTPCFHGTRCVTPLRPRNSARCATYQS